YHLGKSKPTKSKLTRSTNSNSKPISFTTTAIEYTTFDTNNYITNISKTSQLIDSHMAFNINTNNNTNISKTDKLDDYTIFDMNTPVCYDLEDFVNEKFEVSDLKNNSCDISSQLDELDNKNDKYKSKEFLFKLYIKNHDNTILSAKRLNILADSCSDFHYQIELNNTTITRNDYILAYKVAKKTG
ncbi:30743_t:CDS:1, partial [Racocetra persica]